MRYVGTIFAVHQDGYGWIAISSVRKEDGSEHDLQTDEDVYIHIHDCHGFELKTDLEVEFVPRDDTKRGGTTKRASSVTLGKRALIAATASGGIELSVQGVVEGSNVLEHSAVFATWCLTPDAVKRLKEPRPGRRAVKLLIVRWSVGKVTEVTESRQLVDIDRPMATITFDTPGLNRIMALVVVGESEDKLVDTFLGRYNTMYKTTVVAANQCGSSLYADRYVATGMVDVEVPKELFAEKPSDFEWVNQFFTNPPRDQCAYRWRRAFAYTLQPLGYLVIGAIFSVALLFRGAAGTCIALGLLMIGARGIDWRPIVSPSMRLRDIGWNVRGYLFAPNIKGRTVPLFFIASPPAWIVAGITTWFLVTYLPSVSVPWYVILFKTMAILAIPIAVITVIYVISQSIDWDQMALEVRTRLEEDDEGKAAAAIDALICAATGPKEPDPLKLPFRLKTFRFYAAAAKQKVCRGFAAH